MKIVNKKAKFDYDIKSNLEAGIVLSGAEAKAIRAQKVDFQGSYVKIVGGEAILLNLHIGAEGLEDTRRSRKLLLNKKEILSLETKAKAGKLVIIPVSLYNNGRLIKAEIALAKGKRNHEKRDSLKKKDIERELDEAVKGTY